MRREMDLNAGLLQAFIRKVQDGQLPVRIQRGVPFTDENGTELETVVIGHPDTDFDFNEVMAEVINEHYHLKDS